MKKVIWLLAFILFISFTSNLNSQSVAPNSRAMFVSVIQDPLTLSSRDEIKKLIDYSKQANIETLFVQIYRSGKAYFFSKTSDDAPFRDNLKRVGEDSFALLINEAHEAGIEVHAWMNMLSLGANADAKLLQKYGPEILTQNTNPKKSIQDYKIDSQYFLEPGDTRVRKHLVKLVKEVLKRYPSLDGIQFDYIRYPDQDPHYGYAPINMKRFKDKTGLRVIDEDGKIWKDWKRAQVTEFVELLVKTTKKIRPKIKISTTGCMSYVRAYHEAFQDWPSWVNNGLIDFVTIMTYPDSVSEFEKSLTDAKLRVENFKKVKVALPAYKAVSNPENFFKQWQICEESGGGACVVFHYGSLIESRALYDFLAS